MFSCLPMASGMQRIEILFVILSFLWKMNIPGCTAPVTLSSILSTTYTHTYTHKWLKKWRRWRAGPRYLKEGAVALCTEKFLVVSDVSMAIASLECQRVQHEYPYARTPCELLKYHAGASPQRCGASGAAHREPRCHLPTNGHKGEPVASYCHCSQ